MVIEDEIPNDEDSLVNFLVPELLDGQENDEARTHFDLGLFGRGRHDFVATPTPRVFKSSFFGFITVDKSILRDRNVRTGVFAIVSERKILVLVSCNEDFCL